MAPEPAYVRIAGEIARRIRNGELAPGTQLPSQAELAEHHGVSEIVIRNVIALLQRQELVRTIRRRGAFVAERAGLVRVSPERQMETAETSFTNESGRDVRTERDTRQIAATDELAETFGIPIGADVTHTVTRTTEDGQPISISDTYQPADRANAVAAFLEETVADRPPEDEHFAWLGTSPGELAKTVHQRFLTADDQVVMVADVTYPRDRYDAFVFRMALPPDPDTTTREAP